MNEAPERIYNWLQSHLSIARHYGGCEFNGHKYRIAYDEEGQPLVRADVLKKRKRKPPKANAPDAQQESGGK